MPYLSVLLPARDAESTVRQAALSTLRHLPRDAELVILDDGSTDGTAQELGRIKDPRLKVLTGQGSGNLGRALNFLLAQTDSELVARMDADDVTLPGRFPSSLAALRRGADFVFTSAITSQGWRTRPSTPLPIDAAAFPLHLLLNNPVRHPSLTARRTALDELEGYRPRPSEDYDLWLRAALHGFSLVKTPWYGLSYRVHAGQISSGAEWRKRSRADAELQAVFSSLSEAVLGRPFPRLVTLETMPIDVARAQCAEFSRALEGGLARLSPRQRAYLRMKWRRRRAAILAESASTAPADGGSR